MKLGRQFSHHFPTDYRCQRRRARVVNSSTSVSIRANLQMSSVERNVAGECRFSGPVSCRPFLRSLFTSTLSINSFTGFRVHALSAEGYLSASCISAITLTSSLGNRISLMQAMKPDWGSHVTLTFSKATRLFSRWSNSCKSSSSCDSRAVSSATARKSLACEASIANKHAVDENIANLTSKERVELWYRVKYELLSIQILYLRTRQYNRKQIY